MFDFLTPNSYWGDVITPPKSFATALGGPCTRQVVRRLELCLARYTRLTDNKLAALSAFQGRSDLPYMLIWVVEAQVGRIAGGGAVQIGASHEWHRQCLNDSGIFTMF
eukprot:3030542-Pleurochrysis_carterae.AAC.1